MKRRIVLLAAVAGLLIGTAANAQKMAVGERAPEVRIAQWLGKRPTESRARLVDFFHFSSRECIANLKVLDKYAEEYADRLNVIVIAREPKDKVESILTGNSPRYFAALDEDGKTFANFSVQFVPFSVLIDARGRLVWMGNTSQLDDATIGRAIR